MSAMRHQMNCFRVLIRSARLVAAAMPALIAAHPTSADLIRGEWAAEVDGGHPLKIVGFGQANSDGIRKGVVIDIEKTVRSIQQAVRECELMCGVQVKEVLAGIAGHHIEGINGNGMVTVQNNRTVSDDDISRVIEAAQAINIPNDREILHILPEHVGRNGCS